MTDVVDAGTRFAQLQELLSVPQARVDRNQEMVTSYYELVSEICRAGYGDSHHFAPTPEGSTLTAAVATYERDLSDRAGLAPGMKALDVGCGVGGPAKTIAEHSGAHVTGIDLSPVRIAAAREKTREPGSADRLTFLEGNACDLPFADRSFDAVYSIEAICHIPDKDRLYAEIYRVLKSGGIFLGSDWMAADGLPREELSDYIEPICRHHGTPMLRTPGELRSAISGAGFTDVSVLPSADQQAMNRTWGFLEDLVQASEGIDEPVISFMRDGGRSLVRAGRAGKFLISSWTSRRREDG